MKNRQVLNLRQIAQISIRGGVGRDSFAIQAQETKKENEVKEGAKRQLVLTISSNTMLHADSKEKAASCSFKFSNEF